MIDYMAELSFYHYSHKLSFQSDLRRPVWPQFGLCSPILLVLSFRDKISQLPRPIAVKLSYQIDIWLNFIMQVQNWGPSPKKLQAKTCKIFVDFTQFSIANIPGTSIKISKIRKICDRERFLPAIGERSPANFGPLTTKQNMITIKLIHFRIWVSYLTLI